MSFADFLQKHLLTCPFKALLHMECPGCGMQRSFISLMRGNVPQSLAFHPAMIPFLGLLFFAALHLLFRFKNGARIIVILQIIVASITLAFYIYKIINHKIFT